MDYLDRSNRRRSPGGSVVRFVAGLVVLGAIGGIVVGGLRTGDTPTIAIDPEPSAIGKNATTFGISVSEPTRGIARVRVELVQKGQVHPLLDRPYATQPAYAPWATMTPEARFSVRVPKEVVARLSEGPATVRVRAEGASAWFSTPEPAVADRTVPVRREPPSLEILSRHIYPAQGGSEVVVYRVGDTAVRHGVQVGSWFFPGGALPRSTQGEQFAFFGIPHDIPSAERIHLFAEDDVGNAARAPVVDRLAARSFAQDTIRLSDALMRRLVEKVSGAVPAVPREGSLLERYLFINRDLRRDNRRRLRALAQRTAPELSWNRAFLQMPAKAVSAFADRRTYVYRGQTVDRQDHLGFDLASTARSPVPAANAGKVLMAEPLGIYGLVVVVDHGFGLMTLYAHLSSSAVSNGDRVQRGQTIGHTGATGLALGDHLHFTTLIHGLPVNPLEWWDENWVRNRIAAKLGPALGFVGETTE